MPLAERDRNAVGLQLSLPRICAKVRRAQDFGIPGLSYLPSWEAVELWGLGPRL